MTDRSTRARSLVGTVLAYLLAVAAGLAIAWLDVRSDEVILAVVPLVIVGALLGLARPSHPWRWGLVVGAWIPIANWTGAFGAPVAPASDPWSPLLALIPPLLGAGVGSLVERGLPEPDRAPHSAEPRPGEAP